MAVETVCETSQIPRESYLSIGGVGIKVSNSYGAADFHPGLKPFLVDRCNVDIGLHVEWIENLGSHVNAKLFDSGTTWRLYGCESGLQFDFGALIDDEGTYKRLFVDCRFRSAKLQMDTDFFSRFPEAADPLGYPLDELLIMHRLTQERAIELHGTGIVRPNGVANLFVGHSEAGKSTTTRLWIDREAVEVLSDDRIIVRRPPGQSTGPITMYGTPWHGEAMFASPNSAPLTRIFVLEHGHGNVITRLSTSQAVGELFARSFVPFHRHEYIDSALSFLEELVKEVPCYLYSFEPDHRAVEKILNFND